MSMYICICVCIFVFMYVCISCVYHVYREIHTQREKLAAFRVFLLANELLYIHLHTYVCIYVCLYLYLFVCMYTHHIYTEIHLHT